MPNGKDIHVTIITYFAEGMKEIMYAVYSGNINVLSAPQHWGWN